MNSKTLYDARTVGRVFSAITLATTLYFGGETLYNSQTKSNLQKNPAYTGVTATVEQNNELLRNISRLEAHISATTTLSLSNDISSKTALARDQIRAQSLAAQKDPAYLKAKQQILRAQNEFDESYSFFIAFAFAGAGIAGVSSLIADAYAKRKKAENAARELSKSQGVSTHSEGVLVSP